MIFNSKSISDQEYKLSAAKLIGENENTSGQYSPHFDGGNSIALGYGLDLLVNSNDQIDRYFLQAKLPTLNSSQIKLLNEARKQKDTLSSNDYSGICKELDIQLNQAQASDLLICMLAPYEERLSNRLQESPFNITEKQLPKCNMRLALLDLVFNGGPGLIGKNLRSALANAIKNPKKSAEYRGAAWTEIRYFSNGDRGSSVQKGIQNRRNKAADLFSLSDESSTLAELKSTHKYLQDRYLDIVNRDSTGLGYQKDIEASLASLVTQISALEAPSATLDSAPIESIDYQNIYTVQAGDTLTKIAEQLNTTMNDLLNMNPLIVNPDQISVGQIINTSKA